MKKHSERQAQAGRVNPVIIPVALLILGGAGFFVWRKAFADSDAPQNVVFLSGRIEGDDSAVSGKATGRLLELKVREGDTVRAGDVVAVLDDDQLRSRETQANAGVTQAGARLQAAEGQIAVLKEQIRQTAVETGQSREDAQGRVSKAEADLAAAEAELAQQEASLKLAMFDRDAYTRLAKTGAVSERQGKQAETAAETQTALVAASRKRVEAARASVVAANASLKNPEIRTIQGSALQRQIAQQQFEVASAGAEQQRARAQLTEARSNRGDLVISAPFDGTVLTRTAEPGEVVTAGTPVITLLDLRKVYLRGYIPEGQIGRVKSGQPARVYLDSSPDHPLEAVVIRIDPQATFTPENTYFRNDRVKQVVGVKLGLKAGFGNAKPGMPADGEILVGGDSWPQTTRKR